LRAFGKINLGLKVVRKRPDGYHEIRTVYQTVGLHDLVEVSLARGKGIEVLCDDPRIPSGSQNLAYRAAEHWRRACNFRGGIRIRVVKRIPAGAGLGGGSSDAAATLLALERLSGQRLGGERLRGLATRLGSDVPFFLCGGRALGLGRGEEVLPLPDLPARCCLIVFPGFAVSTAVAFRALDRGGGHQDLTKGARGSSIDVFGTWPHLSLKSWGPAENDFERVVFARWPELARLKRQLIRAGAKIVSLTGSGSSTFALFDSARLLERAAAGVPRGWKTFRTRTVSSREYARRLFV
jgi:4-diphosphocytidyl-2-C-methyl-D-erythritol kinase